MNIFSKPLDKTVGLCYDKPQIALYHGKVPLSEGNEKKMNLICSAYFFFFFFSFAFYFRKAFCRSTAEA